MRATILTVLMLMLGIEQSAFAHKPSDSFLKLKVTANRIDGQWDIAIKDIAWVIDLDDNGDGEITWGELKAHHGEIETFALRELKISSGSTPCDLQMGGHLVDDHSDGAYSVLRFTGKCHEKIEELGIDYGLFFTLDAQHRGLVTLEAGNHVQTSVMTTSERSKRLLASTPSASRQFREFLWQGVIHIWLGFDHILFLIVLLLPAVFRQEQSAWIPVKTFREAFVNVVKIVTAFTLAHSLTLTLAALNLILLPSRLVECVIAISVFLAALNNIFPVVNKQQWLIAFFFGLIHGFGFASVLNDLGLSTAHLAVSLVAFNIGVELGQLAIVSVFLPLIFGIRSHLFYRRYSFYGGSLLATIVAICWFIERAAGLKFLPF